MTEDELRERIVHWGASLHRRGYISGSSGNLSVRCPDGFLATPTNSCLGELEPSLLSKLDSEWRHVSGDKPTKEIPLHRAITSPGLGLAQWCICIRPSPRLCPASSTLILRMRSPRSRRTWSCVSAGCRWFGTRGPDPRRRALLLQSLRQARLQFSSPITAPWFQGRRSMRRSMRLRSSGNSQTRFPHARSQCANSSMLMKSAHSPRDDVASRRSPRRPGG